MEAFERLEQLLLSGEFSELADQDQSWLEAQGIGMEAFESQREVLLLSQQMLDTTSTLRPSSEVQRRLGQKIQQLKRRRNTQRYRGLAAGILLFVLGLVIGRSFFTPVTTAVTSEEVPVVIKPAAVRTDTVYLERPLEVAAQPQVIYRERVVYDTVYLPALENLPVAGNNQELLPIVPVEEATTFSRNAKETEALLRVLVEVY